MIRFAYYSLFGFLWFGFILVLESCHSKQMAYDPAKNVRIIDKPIIWDTVRKSLSLQYMKEHYGMTQVKSPLITPEMIVVHTTEIPTMTATFDVFNSPTLRGRRELQSASQLNVSAHFLIDRDGTIYRLLPETAFARHTIGLNHSAIGIENVGTDSLRLTDAQFKSNVLLIKYLHYKYPIRYVIGHMDYLNFKNHPLWKEKDPDYKTIKTDPGDDWMLRLYKAFPQVGVYGVERKVKE